MQEVPQLLKSKGLWYPFPLLTTAFSGSEHGLKYLPEKDLGDGAEPFCRREPCDPVNHFYMVLLLTTAFSGSEHGPQYLPET